MAETSPEMGTAWQATPSPAEARPRSQGFGWVGAAVDQWWRGPRMARRRGDEAVKWVEGGGGSSRCRVCRGRRRKKKEKCAARACFAALSGIQEDPESTRRVARDDAALEARRVALNEEFRRTHAATRVKWAAEWCRRNGLETMVFAIGVT
jgi:hypothetical protein